MAERLDTVRLAKVLGLLGSSHDGERANAGRLANQLVKTAGMSWAEFLAANDREQVATEAAAVLLAETEALRAENTALRSANGHAGVWQDVGSSLGNHRAAAEWALAMYEKHAIGLTQRELEFLRTCKRWHGRLTLRQQPWFAELMARISARTGERPPP
jgi:hypothetical protein